MRWRSSPALVTSSLLFAIAGLASALGPLEYRDRGNRHEGVKGKPVSGYAIELLGAMVEPPHATASFPAQANLRFFLEQQLPLYLTVRERVPQTYYWLDSIETGTAWQPGAANEFSWPSGDVLRPLGLAPKDLLVLARLGTDVPGPRERVAPVLLQGEPGQPTSTYRLTFKTNSLARTRAYVVGPGSSTRLWESGPLLRRSAGIAFDVVWEAAAQPPGTYRIIVEGYFLNDNTGIHQEVELYHASRWPG